MSTSPPAQQSSGKRRSTHRCPSHHGTDTSTEVSPIAVKYSNGKRSDYGGTSHSKDPESQIPATHCHADGTPGESNLNKQARRKLIFASILCLVFMVGEIVGGVLAGSLAITTDAAHLLTDFASFMISLFSLYLATRAPTKRMSFGWARAEVVGALVSVLMIWVVTGVLVYMAIQRVITNDFEIDATIMLITAGVGVGVNIIMGISLHDSHTHSHGLPVASQEEESYSESSEEEDEVRKPLVDSHGHTHSGGGHDHGHGHGVNINVRAAFIHVIGDLVQSVGVCIAATIIFFKPEWKLADPICTFLFSILVLFTTITILKDTMNVLMEGTPRGISYNQVRKALRKLKGVREIHNLRIWSLTMSKAAISVHLAIDKSMSHQEVLSLAGTLMREKFGIQECTIQIEDYVDEMEDCSQCQPLKD